MGQKKVKTENILKQMIKNIIHQNVKDTTLTILKIEIYKMHIKEGLKNQ